MCVRKIPFLLLATLVLGLTLFVPALAEDEDSGETITILNCDPPEEGAWPNYTICADWDPPKEIKCEIKDGDATTIQDLPGYLSMDEDDVYFSVIYDDPNEVWITSDNGTETISISIEEVQNWFNN